MDAALLTSQEFWDDPAPANAAGVADIHAVVRLAADPDRVRAEFAIIVEHALTGLGLRAAVPPRPLCSRRTGVAPGGTAWRPCTQTEGAGGPAGRGQSGRAQIGRAHV